MSTLAKEPYGGGQEFRPDPKDERIAELEAALAHRFTKPEVDALVEQEREACARLIEEWPMNVSPTLDVFAEAIRARGSR